MLIRNALGRNWSDRRRGVAILSLTEVWERFSYAGLRAILVLYLTEWLLIDGHHEAVRGMATLRAGMEAVFGPLSTPALALQIYGIYVGFFYFTPLFGGYVADRLLGHRRTIVLGGVLMMVGQVCLATDVLFLLGLLLMIVGGGLFKPTISAQLGALFDRADGRRERAFAVFYVAINVGTFFAPLVCGTIGERIGWQYGFLAGGAGMFVGLVVFWLGRAYLPVEVRPDRRVETSTDTNDRGNLFALILVATIVPLFWAAYEQKSGAVILWAKGNVDLHIGWLDFDLPTSWILALNPFFIFLFTPLLNFGWSRLGAREPGSVAKMIAGLVLLSVAYLILAAAAAWNDGPTPLLTVASFMVFLTLGELLLSPIGLSLFSRLAPAGYGSLTLALWFLASFVGNYGSGLLASATVTIARPTYFSYVALLPLLGAGLLLLAKPFLSRRTSMVRST